MTDTFELTLTREEIELLHRVYCSGLVGGKPEVRSQLYDKIVRLKKNSRTGTTINGKVQQNSRPDDGVPAKSV